MPSHSRSSRRGAPLVEGSAWAQHVSVQTQLRVGLPWEVVRRTRFRHSSRSRWHGTYNPPTSRTTSLGLLRRRSPLAVSPVSKTSCALVSKRSPRWSESARQFSRARARGAERRVRGRRLRQRPPGSRLVAAVGIGAVPVYRARAFRSARAPETLGGMTRRTSPRTESTGRTRAESEARSATRQCPVSGSAEGGPKGPPKANSGADARGGEAGALQDSVPSAVGARRPEGPPKQRAGRTGLEPAASGVTGRIWAPRQRRGFARHPHGSADLGSIRR